MFAKTYRVWRLFSHSKSIADLNLFGVVGLLFIPEVILLILWSAIDPPSIVSSIDPNTGLPHQVCSYNPTAFIIVDLCYKIVILLSGVFLAVTTKDFDYKYNESGAIGASVYTISLTCTVTIAIIIFIGGQFVTFVMIMLTICVAAGLPVVLYAAKLLIAWKKGSESFESKNKERQDD